MNMSKKTNTPVKNALSAIWSAILCACAVMLATGCGDSDRLAGTSEETNELAENDRSSSSSDIELVEPSSSSVKVMSSGSQYLGDNEMKFSNSSTKKSSSSESVVSSSSEKHSSTPRISSDSRNDSSSSRENLSSSSKKDPPPSLQENPGVNTLEYYLQMYNLKSNSFDGRVLSAKFDIEKGDASASDPVEMVTEFDGPWPHKFVKQNIGALDMFFPTAAKMYSEIVDSIKNETLDPNCGLYMFNVYGNANSAGYILADIAKDTIVVLDIPIGKCNSMSGNIERFLFYYCGEIDSRPEVVHMPVENYLSEKCPVVKNREEWVKDNSRTP